LQKQHQLVATEVLTVKSLPVKSLRFPNPHLLRYWVPVSSGSAGFAAASARQADGVEAKVNRG